MEDYMKVVNLEAVDPEGEVMADTTLFIS